GRRRMLALTDKGRATFAPFDSRQDEEVAALLARAPAAGQRRLIEAMRAIETVLAEPAAGPGAAYRLRRHRPGDLYSREYGYDERFEALVATIVAEFIERFDPARERCWIAERDGEIVGS